MDWERRSLRLHHKLVSSQAREEVPTDSPRLAVAVGMRRVDPIQSRLPKDFPSFFGGGEFGGVSMEIGFLSPRPGTDAAVWDLNVAFGPTHLDSTFNIRDNGLGEDVFEGVEAWVDGNGLRGMDAVYGGHRSGEAGLENMLGYY